MQIKIYNLPAQLGKENKKASDNKMSKSLNYYANRYKLKYSIRCSSKNFGEANGIKSILLYASHLI